MADWEELAEDDEYEGDGWEEKAVKDLENELEESSQGKDDKDIDIVDKIMKRGRENMIKEARDLIENAKGQTKDETEDLISKGRAKF